MSEPGEVSREERERARLEIESWGADDKPILVERLLDDLDAKDQAPAECRRELERLREQNRRWAEATRHFNNKTLGYMEACAEGLPVEALDKKQAAVFEASLQPAIIEMIRRKPDGTPLPGEES